MEPSIAVAIIAATASIATAGLGFAQRRHVADVREQVKNSHGTNLRDDIDRVLDGMELLLESQRQHAKEIGGLREEMRHERVERRDLEQRLDDHLRTAQK